jgi:hypothetical protein
MVIGGSQRTRRTKTHRSKFIQEVLIGLGKEMSKRVAIMEVYNLMDLFGVCWGEGTPGRRRE